MSRGQVEQLFDVCDVTGKGYLNETDLIRVCPQLSQTDIAFIFAQLDADGSGTIDKEEFINGFEDVVMKGEHSGLNGMGRRASLHDPMSPEPGPHHQRLITRDEEVFDSDYDSSVGRPNLLRPIEEYHSESDTNMSVDFSLPCQDEVLMLYEQLQSSGMHQLLRKYEKVVGSFYKEIKEKKSENERLQHVYHNEREMYNKRMEEVESEIDQHLQEAEKKAREEERERLTREKEEMRAKLEEEMREMKDNIRKLQKMESVLQMEGEKLNHQKELQSRLQEVSSENNELRRSMAENHLELAMIKSELAHSRADYELKSTELERQRDEASSAIQENEGAAKQLQLLLDANKKLHETNENLREALDSRASVIRQFNLRTPSPMNRSPSTNLLTPTPNSVDSRKLFSPVTPGLPTPAMGGGYEEDEVIDGFEYATSESSTKPKADQAAQMGYHEATGPAERTFRVVTCGDAAVGKSSLVTRIVSGQFSSQLPSTLGVDFHVKTVCIDGHNVALQLWDTAGQERFRSLCKSYFRRADGALLVYDVTSEHSFIRVREWVETIKESVERSIPIILIGNKKDLRQGDKDGVPTSEGAAMAAALGTLFVETSAKDGGNIESAMLTLSRELMAVEDVDIRASGVILSPRQQKKSGCFSRCKSS